MPALHRLDGFEPGGVVEVLVPMAVRLRRPGIVVHHTRDLPDLDRCRVGAIPTTTVARTLIDLGAVVPAEVVEEAFDAAERDRKVSRAQVERRYQVLRAPGRSGIGAMTQILPDREPARRVARSVLERRFRRLLERAGLPAPVSQFKVQLLDGGFVMLDFAYPACKAAFEIDGHGAHATRRARAADDRRANDLADLGWTVRRFTFEQVMYSAPEVVAAVRRAIRPEA